MQTQDVMTARGGAGESGGLVGFVGWIGLALLVLLGAGGCAMDLSRGEAFSGQVGRLQEVEREAWLKGEREPYELKNSRVTSEQYGLLGLGHRWEQDRVTERLPMGARVLVERVKRRNDGVVFAEGLIWPGESESAVRFESVWGRDGRLTPAVWEPMGTPSVRQIDDRGGWAVDPALRGLPTYQTAE